MPPLGLEPWTFLIEQAHSTQNRPKQPYTLLSIRWLTGAKLLQLFALAFPEAYPRLPWQFGVFIVLFMSLQGITGFMAYLDEFVDFSDLAKIDS